MSNSSKMLEADDNIVKFPSVLNEILAGQKLRETKSASKCLENVECLPVRKSKKLQNSKKKIYSQIKKRRCKNANNLICCCSTYKKRNPYAVKLKKANEPNKIANRLLLTKKQHLRLLSKPKPNYYVPNICGKPIKNKRKFTYNQVSDAFFTRLSRPKRAKLLNTFQKYQKILPASKLESIFKQLQRGNDDNIKSSEKRFCVKKTIKKVFTKKFKKKEKNKMYIIDCLAYKFSIKLTAFLTLQTNRNRNTHTIETIAELIFLLLRSSDGICCHNNICKIDEDMWEYLRAAAHFLICILEHVYCEYEIIKKRSAYEDYGSSGPSEYETESENETSESSSEDSSDNDDGKRSYPHPQKGETSKEKSPYYYTQVQQGPQSGHYIEITDDKYYKNIGQTTVTKLADVKQGKSPIKIPKLTQKIEPFLNQQYVESFDGDAKTGKVFVQKLESKTQKGRESSLSSEKGRQQVSPKGGKQKYKYLDSSGTSEADLRVEHKSADQSEYGASKYGSPKYPEHIPPKGRKQTDRKEIVSSDTLEDELRSKHKSADRREQSGSKNGPTKDRERISPKEKKEKHRKDLGSSPSFGDDRRDQQKSTDQHRYESSRERIQDRKQTSPKDGKLKDLRDLTSSDISDNYLRSKHKSKEDSPKGQKQISPQHKKHKDLGSSNTSDNELRDKRKSTDRRAHKTLKKDSPKDRKQISPKDKQKKDRDELRSSESYDDLRGKRKTGLEKDYIDSRGQKFDSKKPTDRIAKDRSTLSPDSSPRRHTSSSSRSNFSTSPLRQESPDTYGKDSPEGHYPERKKYAGDKQFFKGASPGESSPTSGTILDDLEKELSKSPTSDKKYFRTKQEYEVDKDVIRDERGRPVNETTSEQKIIDENDETAKSGYPDKSITEYTEKDIDDELKFDEKSDISTEKGEFIKVEGKPKNNYGKKDEVQLSSDNDESQKYDGDEKQGFAKDKKEKEQDEKESSSPSFNIPEFREEMSSKDRESPIEEDSTIKSSEKISSLERNDKKKDIHAVELSDSESTPEDGEIQKEKKDIKDKKPDASELESEPSLSEVDDIQKWNGEKIKKEKDGTLESELEDSKKGSKSFVPDDDTIDAVKVKKHENNLDQITDDEKKELELPKTLQKIPRESLLDENVDDKIDLSSIGGITDTEIDTEIGEGEEDEKRDKKQKKLPKSGTSDSELSIKSLPDYIAEDNEETIRNLRELEGKLYEDDKVKAKSMKKHKRKIIDDDDYLAGQEILKQLEKEEQSSKQETEEDENDRLDFLDDVIVLNVKESDSIGSDIMSIGPRKLFVFPNVKHPVYTAQNIRLDKDICINCPRIKCPDYFPITQKPSYLEHGSKYEKQKYFTSLTKCIVPHVNIMPHGTERICCASLKAWALWIKDVAESAKVWCHWINSIICDMQTITALMRGEVYNEHGKKRILTCKDWQNFVQRFDSDISIWNHYNKHVQKNTKQILNYCNCTRIVQYCRQCQQENFQCSSKNADHLYKQLAVALKTTKYWRTWLHAMILESQSLFELIEVSCKYATHRPTCVCKYNDGLAQCSIYSIRSLNEDK